MKIIKWLIPFLFINFGGLALGSWLMNNGPRTEWYLNLNKAPWTPPGWVFGISWSFIMICFSLYLAYLFTKTPSNKAKIAFSIQLFLNVIWNYLFFNLHEIEIGLVCIVLLSSVVFYFFFGFKQHLEKIKFLLLPYIVWLLIATSLNAYILFNN